MALNYLLSPEFQICTTSGKPATNGYIEVFIHGTHDRYYCAMDWNGTLHPFRIPLDSLGSSVVLADDGRSYDVYIYNRYGSLLMSRYNVHPASGGGMGNITSSDGTIEVTPTETGVDLSVKGAEPSVLIAVSAARTSDGAFSFTPIKRTGTEITVSPQSRVMLDSGWYHYDIALSLDWEGTLANAVNVVTVSTSAGDHEYGIDLSYAHSQAVHVSGEFHATDDATEFSVSIADLPVGTTATVYDLGIHSIKGVGGAGSGQFEQKQADWTQQDVSDPSYILHKPEVKTVVEGDNIDITEGATTFTISADLSGCATREQLAALQSTVSSLSSTLNTLQTSVTDLSRNYNSHGVVYDSTSHRVQHVL